MAEQGCPPSRQRSRFCQRGSRLRNALRAVQTPLRQRFSNPGAAAGARRDVSLRNEIFIDVQHRITRYPQLACQIARGGQARGARENTFSNRLLHADKQALLQRALCNKLQTFQNMIGIQTPQLAPSFFVELALATCAAAGINKRVCRDL